MTRASVTFIGLAATLLVACNGNGGAPTTPTARIEVFTADERVPRNAPVTLLWLAADAGVQDGMLSCELTRRLGDEPTETPLDATCTGSLTEVPPAPLSAATVHYELKVLKQPYDASDPYLSETRSITLDPAMYASRAGGTSNVDATSVSTLADGSAIIAGYFLGTATVGATTLTSAGFFDAFVAKTNADGSWAWATSAGGTGSVRAFGVDGLADGGAYVVGPFEGTATFGATTLTSTGDFDAFLARVNPDGSWAWATSAGGSGNAYAHGVSTLADGGAVITGRFEGTATFGATTLTSAGSFDAFLARVNPDGSWAWATSAGGTDYVRGLGIGTLADGSAIITGSVEGTATFGTTTLTSVTFTDTFVAKANPDGSWAWATSAGGTSFGVGRGITTLADGSAMITGDFQAEVTFGDTTLTSARGSDAFVARIHPDGSWAWATRAGGSSFTGGYGVSPLADGSAIITGTFYGTVTFGATNLSSAGSGDAFVARVYPDGSWAWAARAGGTADDQAFGVSALGDGGAIVTGHFGETVTFGATTLTSAGGINAFVARMGADGTW